MKLRTIDYVLLVVALLLWFQGGGGGFIDSPQPIKAVTIEESADSTQLSAAQVAALNAWSARDYMAAKGFPYHTRIDPDQITDTSPAWLKAAKDAAKAVELPALVVVAQSSDKVLYSGHVATEADLTPILTRYGGE